MFIIRVKRLCIGKCSRSRGHSVHDQQVEIAWQPASNTKMFGKSASAGRLYVASLIKAVFIILVKCCWHGTQSVRPRLAWPNIPVIFCKDRFLPSLDPIIWKTAVLSNTHCPWRRTWRSTTMPQQNDANERMDQLYVIMRIDAHNTLAAQHDYFD